MKQMRRGGGRESLRGKKNLHVFSPAKRGKRRKGFE